MPLPVTESEKNACPMAQIQIMGSVRASHRGVNINRYPRGAGQEKYPYRQHQEDEEKQRHHDLIGLFYAVGPRNSVSRVPTTTMM